MERRFSRQAEVSDDIIRFIEVTIAQFMCESICKLREKTHSLGDDSRATIWPIQAGVREAKKKSSTAIYSLSTLLSLTLARFLPSFSHMFGHFLLCNAKKAARASRLE